MRNFLIENSSFWGTLILCITIFAENLLLLPFLFVCCWCIYGVKKNETYLLVVLNVCHINIYFQKLKHLKFFNEWNFLIKFLTMSQWFMKSKNFRGNIENCYSLFCKISWEAKYFICVKIYFYNTYLPKKYLFVSAIDLFEFETTCNLNFWFLYWNSSEIYSIISLHFFYIFGFNSHVSK